MEEKSSNVKTKEKGIKKITLLIIAIITVMLLGVNAFASVNGYGNIFFMIKNIVTTGTLSGEEEIFSDKEITLSYKSIDVADGVKVQINKLEIKENESTLCLTVKADEENKVLPLKFSLKSEGLSERDIEVEDATQKYGEFEERLTVNYKFSPDELMTLYIKDKDGNLLREIEINLDSHEIFVKSDESVEKISQIELKKYLNVFSELNNVCDVDNKLLEMADEIWINVLGKKDIASREVTNQIVKEFYGEKAEFKKTKDADGKEVEVVKFGQAWTYGPYDGGADYIYMTAAEFSEYQQGVCLKIKDISYEDGIYTVDYIYTLATYYDIDDEKIEELPQYEAIIKLKLNEDAKYSKYQVVELSKGKEVKEKVSVDIEDLKGNDNNDNNLSELKAEPTDFAVEDIYGRFNVTRVVNTNTKADMKVTDVFGYHAAYIFILDNGTFETNITSTNETTGLDEKDISGKWEIVGNKIVLTYPDSKKVTLTYDNTMNLHDNVSRSFGDYTIYLEKDYSWLKEDSVDGNYTRLNPSGNLSIFASSGETFEFMLEVVSSPSPNGNVNLGSMNGTAYKVEDNVYKFDYYDEVTNKTYQLTFNFLVNGVELEETEGFSEHTCGARAYFPGVYLK